MTIAQLTHLLTQARTSLRYLQPTEQYWFLVGQLHVIVQLAATSAASLAARSAALSLESARIDAQRTLVDGTITNALEQLLAAVEAVQAELKANR